MTGGREGSGGDRGCNDKNDGDRYFVGPRPGRRHLTCREGRSQWVGRRADQESCLACQSVVSCLRVIRDHLRSGQTTGPLLGRAFGDGVERRRRTSDWS